MANDPSSAEVAALEAGAPDRSPIGGREPEVLRTSVRLGYAAALNIGLRRAEGTIVLLADGTAVPTGDALTPLSEALADAEVAAVGAYGLLAEDGVPFRPNMVERTKPDPDADLEVAGLEAAWLAFRRDDLTEVRTIDEHFVTPAWLDLWLTLRLRVGPMDMRATDMQTDTDADGDRDGVEGVEAEADPDSVGPADTVDEALEEIAPPAPRRALMINLPLVRDEVQWPPDRTRLNRRQMYRVLDAFGWRDDLA